MGDDWPEQHGGRLTRTCLPQKLAIWLLDDEFTAAMAGSCFHLADPLEAGPTEGRYVNHITRLDGFLRNCSGALLNLPMTWRERRHPVPTNGPAVPAG
jgi:hypothetical protein